MMPNWVKCNMNSHRYSQKEILDLRLRKGMLNWLKRKQPPIDLRAQILQAAASERSSQKSAPPHFWAFVLHGEFTNLSFERFAKAKAYSLQLGFLIV
jgi:hypothetical protein